MNKITFPIGYYPDPDQGRPISGGSIYIGQPDTDPTIPGNQKTVTALQENGTLVPISQPILTSAGGVPLYNGSPVSLYVDGDYSMRVDDSLGSQEYYIPSNIQQDASEAFFFDTVAAMTAEELTAGNVYFTKGYYVPGDNGQAAYLVKTAVDYGSIPDGFGDHYDAAGNVAVLQTVNVSNVLQFGVKGDGVTNDYAAIQAAYDYGNVKIVFPNTQSSYQFGTTLSIPSTVRQIVGEGYPVIQPSAAGVKFTADTGLSDVLITGINFTGAAGGSELSTDQMMTITNSSGIKLIDNIFTNCWHRAIYLIGCEFSEVRNNRFDHCSNGPYFTGCNGCVISENIIDGSQQADSVFKIGIALQTIDATYGQNRNLAVSDNVIRDLANAQGILGHGGVGMTVEGNVITNCAQGINFNRQNAGDNIQHVSIVGNRLAGVGGAVAYAPAAEVGVTLSCTTDVGENCVIANNTIRNYNNKDQNVNLGGISIISMSNVNISDNVILDCYANGIVFSGADSSSVNVKNNVITDIAGTGAFGGIKVASPTVVTGEIKGNFIKNCDRAFRLDTSTLQDLVIDSDSETLNSNASTGNGGAIFNRAIQAAAADATPTVKYNCRFLITTNAGATNVTNLDDGFLGQLVVIRDQNSNTTIKDASTGGNFQLLSNADFTFTANDTLTVVYNGATWLEVARSLN